MVMGEKSTGVRAVLKEKKGLFAYKLISETRKGFLAMGVGSFSILVGQKRSREKILRPRPLFSLATPHLIKIF